MKKVLGWTAAALAFPPLLFIILAALLYLPPVQNWVADGVASLVSKETGMEISVGRVSLKWPLDLGIDHFTATHEDDTIADVGRLVADVQLRPLFHQRIVVNRLELDKTRLNTNGYISDVQVRGRVERLQVASRGIDLRQQTVQLNDAQLTGANIDIALTDTAATDTTTTENRWLITLDRLAIADSDVALHLPGDTLTVQARLGDVAASDGRFDLLSGHYSVGSLQWRDGAVSYDDASQPATQGLDPAHLALTDIALHIDSIDYAATPATALTLNIRQLTLHEKSGLHITELRGPVRLDSARVQLPQFVLRTPDSDIMAEADVALSVADSLNPGKMHVRLNAQIGKQDLLRLAGNLPQTFARQYPNHPLSIKGSVNGNLQRIEFTGLDISLPTALRLKASGFAADATTPDQMRAQIAMKAETQDLDFVSTLLTASLTADYQLPRGMTLNGQLKADRGTYDVDATLTEGAGTVKAVGTLRLPTGYLSGQATTALPTYTAKVSVSQIDLHHFMPHDSLYTVTADADVEGTGYDPFSKRSRLQATANVGQLKYGSWNLTDMTAEASLRDGHATGRLSSTNTLVDGSIAFDALLDKNRLEATLKPSIQAADIYRLRLSDEELTIGLGGSLDISSDLQQRHHVKGLLTDLFIKDEKRSYRPEPIGLLIDTSKDTTRVRAQSGDFIVRFDAQGGYERLTRQATTLADSIMAQYRDNVINQPLIKQLLPTASLHVESRQGNPLANLLNTYDIRFRDFLLDVATSPAEGINGQAHLYALDYDSTLIDTIRLELKQKSDRLTFNGQVRNNRRNPQLVFNALFDGHVTEHGALAGLRYFDDHDRMGIRLGAQASMEPGGIRTQLIPERPTIGYKVFTLNADNYILLRNDKRIEAKVDLIADDKTGLKIYTEQSDSTLLQDLTVSVNRLDLGELTAVMPYLPKITGRLNGDYHIVQNHEGQFSVASDMAVSDMTYERAPIGNLSTELVYMQREDDGHAIEARLMLDDEEFGSLQGTYHPAPPTGGSPRLNATFTMTRLPLSLANGFVPDQLIGLDGYAEGSVDIKGSTDRPDVNGEVYLDSAYLVSQPYGVRMRFDNDPVRIVGSHLLLENFGLYAYNDQPLNLYGDIDFTNTANVKMDMRMRAQNLQVINSRQEARSITYGRAFVDLFARLNGPLDALSMRGRLNVLGSTDMTYMLLDSPLSTDNRLDELVRFTDFTDTTQVSVARPRPTGLNADLTVSVSQGAHIVCNLNAEQTNYVDLMGGGDLRMRYNAEGLTLTGRYTLNSGEMKYSMPVIPLKTFTIQDGSYVEFTGDPMNPRLNITATERTKASVGQEGEQSRSVAFDCGVVITKTLADMGLQFIISAPEDMAVNGELQSMSAEERGKLAVTMLTTGMYLADGNTSGFSMNSALSSFLQSEINNITGSALKTLDLSVGMDNTTDASGATHTDYSFKFSKRFFDNRLKIQLGGKVSSDSETPGQQQSFFDNVTMEYRLDQTAQKNVKLFYYQNIYDWLDGYTGLYGGGFVWRKKMDSLFDIFRPAKPALPAQRPGTPLTPQGSRATAVPADSIKVPADSIKKGGSTP